MAKKKKPAAPKATKMRAKKATFRVTLFAAPGARIRDIATYLRRVVSDPGAVEVVRLGLDPFRATVVELKPTPRAAGPISECA